MYRLCPPQPATPRRLRQWLHQHTDDQGGIDLFEFITVLWTMTLGRRTDPLHKVHLQISERRKALLRRRAERDGETAQSALVELPAAQLYATVLRDSSLESLESFESLNQRIPGHCHR